MSSNFDLEIKVKLDTAEGRTRLEQFSRAFDGAMRKLGKSDADIAFIKKLSADIDKGKVKLNEIDAAWRQAVQSFRSGTTGAKLMDTLGLERHADIKARIEEIRRSFTALKSSGTVSNAELAQAARTARARINELSASMTEARGAAGGMAASFGRIQSAIAAFMGLAAGGGLSRLSDEMALLSGRLRLSEGSALAARQRLGQLNEIANVMQVDIGAAGESYVRFARSIRAIGGDTQDALDFTEALGLALKVSGASAEEASGVMRQLSQAMAKGKLQGDEFVTVSESGSRVLDYLADALGKTRGELIDMAKNGELTAATLLKLNTRLEQIRKDAAALPQTVGGAFQQLTNAMKMWVNDSEASGLATKGLILTFNGLAENINAVINLIAMMGAGALLLKIDRLKAMLAGMGKNLGIVAGLHPVARAIMLVGTAATVAAPWIKGLWESIDEGAASARRIGDLRVAFESMSGGISQAVKNIDEALETTKTALGNTVKQIAADAKLLQQAFADALTRRSSGIDDALREQLSAITNAGRSERDQIRETTNAHIDAARQKVAAADQAGRDMMAAWAESSRIQIDAARAAGTGVAEAERAATEDRKRILDTLAGHYRSIIDQMVAETNRHLDAARRADEELARFRMTTEDRVRELRRRGMDESAAYQDRLRQIEEKQAAARAALQAGDFERAKQLAEQAISLAESSARQVTKTVEQNGKTVTQTVVSEAQASAKAIAEIEKASKLVEAALQGQGNAHRNAAAEAKSAYEDVKQKLADVQGQMDKLAGQQVKTLTLDIQANIDKATQSIDEIEEMAKAKELLIAVKLDIDTAKAELAKIGEGGAMTIEASVAVANAEAAINKLRAEQASNPLGLVAQIDTGKALAAINELKRPTDSKHAVNIDAARAQAAIRDLQRPTSSRHTVYVTKVATNATGGMAGDGIARFAFGGQVFRRRRPGLLFGPGTGTSDSIPSMLSAGEYIVRAASVRKYGRALLDAINSGLYAPVPRFATGGLVAAGASGGGGGGDGAGTMNINLSVGGQRVKLQGARDQAMALAGALRELSRGAK